jgi:hypothetical protein
MQDIITELNKARVTLGSEKFHEQWNYRVLAECLEQLASMFQRTSHDQDRDLIAQFHDCTGKLPYVFDQDFGALVLESVATNIDDKQLRTWLLTEARFRATWCAQAGTAGGECIARYQHVNRLDGELRDDA